MKGRCDVKGCGQEYSYTYLGIDLCENHWASVIGGAELDYRIEVLPLN